jgi:hypothetical protein
MVVLKVLKNENMLFKALTMGLGNASAYDVIVDKKTVATLQTGEETMIDLSQGLHTVFFKFARSMGVKSNKLTIDIDPNKDYIVQAQYGMGGVVASYSLKASTDGEIIKCPNCGAPNKITNIKSTNCEYCGSPLR